MIVTLAGAGLLAWHVITQAGRDRLDGNYGGIAEGVIFAGIALGLVYGNVVYQLTRIGYMQRLRKHRPATRGELDALSDPAPSLCVLVPSYKEDSAIVWRTLLSAALQEYPDKRVVLLIDDPPAGASAGDRELLAAARGLPGKLEAVLMAPRREMEERAAAFEKRCAAGELNGVEELLQLAGAHETTARWLRAMAAGHPGRTHSDDHFVQLTYAAPAEAHARRTAELQACAACGGPAPRSEEIRAEYRRLAGRFRATATSFERKQYANLSHEANKAMNLNSYIGLLGGRWRARARNGGTVLEAPGKGDRDGADLDVPASDYLITLDADSILAPEYAVRLIEFAERPENQRVAVVQTPYSAEPNPPGATERIAGATTDMQYVIHQGFTHYDATFWVGANALLRVRALQDIGVEEEERGFRVRRYIQDRTVIEDTESSIDLAARGWRLHNYPERLSYSATPADYGALLIQRRRWANGGLIILPKLLKYVLQPGCLQERAAEGFFRVHYLTSISLVNLALPLMMVCPFEGYLRSAWLLVASLPYFLVYSRDLVQAGYRWSDVWRVYAMNLLLVPVNVGGVLKSLQQGWTGEKIPFGRTPKVMDRTAVPAGYLLAAYAILFYSLVMAGVDAASGRWAHGLFGVSNALLMGYGIGVYIGWRASWEDLLRSLPSRAPEGAGGRGTLDTVLTIQPAAAEE